MDHLGNFISAKDSIDIINKKISHGEVFKKGKVRSIIVQLNDVVKKSNELFQPVIENKTHCEKVQRVVTILKKYHQIFYLPSNIREFMIKKEYKKLIYEYKKAKYYRKILCGDTGRIRIFGPIFNKIDIEIKSFKQFFLRQLENHLKNFTFEQLTSVVVNKGGGDIGMSLGKKNFVKIVLNNECEGYLDYLYSLDTLSCPSKWFLNQFKIKIIEIIDECYKKYEVKMTKKGVVGNGDEEEGVCFEFIKKINNILIVLLPDFIQLCENISKNKYDASESNSDEEIKDLKEPLKDIIKKFKKKNSALLQRIDNKTAHQKTKENSVHFIIKSYEKLYFECNFKKKQEIFHYYSSYIQLLKREYCKQIWERTVEEIKRFHMLENWIIFDETKRITVFPSYFEKHIKKTMNFLSPLLKNLLVVKENEKFLKKNYEYFVECLNVFCDCIFLICKKIQNKTLNEKNVSEKDCSGFISNSPISNDNKLLVLIGNITYTKEFIIPTLLSKFRKIKCFENVVSNDSKSFNGLFKNLTKIIIDYFIKNKTNILVKFLEKGLLLSGYNWKDSKPPTGIRSFILDLFLELSLIHSDIEQIEVSINSKELSKAIFSSLAERISELFMEYLVSQERICTNAAFQLDIEISFVRKCLIRFENTNTNKLYDNINAYLKNVANFNLKKKNLLKVKEKIINESINKSKFQLSCFLNE